MFGVYAGCSSGEVSGVLGMFGTLTSISKVGAVFCERRGCRYGKDRVVLMSIMLQVSNVGLVDMRFEVTSNELMK